jgi:hypothetical protein
MKNFDDYNYETYDMYKHAKEENKLKDLIYRKYLKVLGRFIKDTLPGVKFDIYVRHRNPREKSAYWYGHTYMELVIFDVITPPNYYPDNFDAVYKTPHSEEFLNYRRIYDEIESFIPEINKHLMITFVNDDRNFNEYTIYKAIPSFECWSEYFHRNHINEIDKYTNIMLKVFQI